MVGEYEKLAFSTNISLYFGNATRYGYNYNSRRIETRFTIYQIIE